MPIKKNSFGRYTINEWINGTRVRQSLRTSVYSVAQVEAEKLRKRYGALRTKRLRVSDLVAEVLADSEQRNGKAHLRAQRHILGLCK